MILPKRDLRKAFDLPFSVYVPLGPYGSMYHDAGFNEISRRLAMRESHGFRLRNVLVTGAGGFIGAHLVSYLKKRGHWVRGLDLEYPAFSQSKADEFIIADLRNREECAGLFNDVDDVCALAADIGGIGHITKNEADILRNNTFISFNSLELARAANVDRLLFASSACVYPTSLQTKSNVVPLREEDAFPADPQGAYGLEKLYTEQACFYYSMQYAINTRVARLHNIYGPESTYEGGREKAPAALCRKVALARSNSAIEIWGDGQQTRSFCYIEDCVAGLYELLYSDVAYPVNIGSSELVSIESLARLIIEISGKENIELAFVKGPEGVRGRNSDNTTAHRVLGRLPTTSLRAGIAYTYAWIEKIISLRDDRE